MNAQDAWAQSSYGVGGYLERPEVPEDARNGAADDGGTSQQRAAAQRQRGSGPVENPLAMPGLDHGPQTAPPGTRRKRTERQPETPQRRSGSDAGAASNNAARRPAAQSPTATRPATVNNATGTAARPVSQDAAAVPPAQASPGTVPTVAVAPAPAPAPIAAVVTPAADPLDRIIGQMLMVGFRSQTADDPWTQKLAAQIKSGTVGGVIFLAHNIVSPQQVASLTAEFQRANGDVPVLLAVDQEGGIVQRLAHDKGFAEYPTAGQVGKSNDPLTAYTVYKNLATEMASYGFNLNMGPVVDLQRDDTSIIAGKERAFGSRPMHVTAFAKAFCSAHRDVGVLTALKHFPGHGSTGADTHTGAADVSKSWSPEELEPYRQLIKSGSADLVMVGHVAHAEMSDEPDLPASLSEKAINKRLRGKLGFTGVVVSDDLEMGAVAKRFPLENSIIRAINAGTDIVLLGNQNDPSPDLPQRAMAIIKDAVAKGTVSRKRLQQSYDRIIALKRKLKVAPKPIVSAKQEPAEKPPAPNQ